MRPRLRWALVAAFAAVIFAASSLERPTPSPPAIPGLDKALHFAVFFLFAATLRWALCGSGIGATTAALLAACLTCLYGASDEIHQAFVPGRTATWGDWLADSFGGFAMASALLLRRRIKPRYQRKGP